MAEFIVTCDVPFIVGGANNGVRCPTGNIQVHEQSQTIADLSQSEIGELSAAVVILFTIAFVFRAIRKMMYSPGRN